MRLRLHLGPLDVRQSPHVFLRGYLQASLEVFVCFEGEDGETVDDVLLDERILGFLSSIGGPRGLLPSGWRFVLLVAVRRFGHVPPLGLHALGPFSPPVPLLYLGVHGAARASFHLFTITILAHLAHTVHIADLSPGSVAAARTEHIYSEKKRSRVKGERAEDERANERTNDNGQQRSTTATTKQNGSWGAAAVAATSAFDCFSS